jgi:F-type H+-transporting ATPase subunit epsilon
VFKVAISDQERKLYEGLASEIRLPGTEGEFAVLDFHAPLISLLQAGSIVVDGQYLPIRKGIVRVDRNQVVVLVER